jgi:hypothetical protein
MPVKCRYLFIASMDVDPDKEALFNEVYDTEHVPSLLKVPACTPLRACRASHLPYRLAAKRNRSHMMGRAIVQSLKSMTLMFW